MDLVLKSTFLDDYRIRELRTKPNGVRLFADWIGLLTYEANLDGDGILIDRYGNPVDAKSIAARLGCTEQMVVQDLKEFGNAGLIDVLRDDKKRRVYRITAWGNTVQAQPYERTGEWCE